MASNNGGNNGSNDNGSNGVYGYLVIGDVEVALDRFPGDEFDSLVDDLDEGGESGVSAYWERYDDYRSLERA